MCPYAWDRPGGVQSHVRALSHVLQERGHETLVVAPTSSRSVEGLGQDVARAGRAVGIPANGSVAPISFGPLAASALRRSLRGFGPDIIHAHEPLIPSLSLLALWASGLPPIVGTFHAAAEESLGYRTARPILDRAARRLSLRTAVSESARSLVHRYFPGEYAITPNGVELERFADADRLDLGPGPHVLFLGRIERRKGLEVLIQAMARVRDLDVTLVVAGEGPEAKSAEAMARSLDVRARFIGSLAEDDVPRAYRTADVYCAPGLGGESFGIVLVEAMAAGAPVVCSDLPGFRAVVGEAAVRVPPGDADKLADALRAALTDRKEELARRSSERAHVFDWKNLVVGVEAIYRRALAQAA